MNDTLILGMDIGGTNFRMGVVNTSLEVSNVKILPSSLITHTESTIESVAEIINEYISSLGKKADDIRLIASGWPSLVDKSRHILLSSTNFPGVDGVDIVDELEKRISIPIIIEHDAYYILANDIHKNRISTDGAVLGFYFGTGMGNAIYIDGKEFIGNHGAASEIGHMPMGLGDRPCSCGNTGCAEMYSCGKAFQRLCEKTFPETSLPDVFVVHKDSEELDEFVRCMAVPIATEVNILDPSYVFIGGGIVYMKGYPKDKLRSYIMKNVRKPFPADGLNLIFSDNTPNNGIIGAAINGYRKLGIRLN